VRESGGGSESCESPNGFFRFLGLGALKLPMSLISCALDGLYSGGLLCSASVGELDVSLLLPLSLSLSFLLLTVLCILVGGLSSLVISWLAPLPAGVKGSV
jgi:hypothetical protein